MSAQQPLEAPVISFVTSCVNFLSKIEFFHQNPASSKSSESMIPFQRLASCSLDLASILSNITPENSCVKIYDWIKLPQFLTELPGKNFTDPQQLSVTIRWIVSTGVVVRKPEDITPFIQLLRKLQPILQELIAIISEERFQVSLTLFDMQNHLQNDASIAPFIHFFTAKLPPHFVTITLLRGLFVKFQKDQEKGDLLPMQDTQTLRDEIETKLRFERDPSLRPLLTPSNVAFKGVSFTRLKHAYPYILWEGFLTLVVGSFPFLCFAEFEQLLAALKDVPRLSTLFNDRAINELIYSTTNALRHAQVPGVRLVVLLRSFFSFQIEGKHFPIFLECIRDLAGTSVFDSFFTLATTTAFNDPSTSTEINRLVELAHYEKFPNRPIEAVLAETRQKDIDVEYPLCEVDPDLMKVAEDEVRQIERLSDQYRTMVESTLLSEIFGYQSQYKEGREPQHAKIQMLAGLRELHKRCYGIFLYNLQMFNVVVLINSPRILGQIKSGEGKSSIVALIAAFTALIGKKFHVMTLSEDLATRDTEAFKSFYKKLHIACQHNFGPSGNGLSGITYGTPGSFENIYLKYATEKWGGGDFQNTVLFVDEVDYITYDARSGGSAFSRPLPIDPNIYGVLAEYAAHPSSLFILRDLRTFLESREFRGLPDTRLSSWLRGFRAMKSIQEGVDYIIDHSTSDRIVLMNVLMGQRKNGYVYSDGVHQLLQLRHNLRPLKAESETTARIQTQQYVLLYAQMKGASGTLGSKQVREALKKTYGVVTYDSPRYLKSQRQEQEAGIFEDGLDHMRAVVSNTIAEIKKGRPVLIICQSVQATETVYTACQETPETLRLATKMQTYNKKDLQEDAKSIVTFAGQRGVITIATNAAGRGTHIETTPEAEVVGGLHVILTFPAELTRVEEQAFARTGRQGKKGTFIALLNKVDIEKFLKTNGQKLANNLSSQGLFQYFRVSRERVEEQTIALNYTAAVKDDVYFNMMELVSRIPETAQTKPWSNFYGDLYSEGSRLDEIKTDCQRTQFFNKSLQLLLEYWVTLKLDFRMQFPTPLHFAFYLENGPYSFPHSTFEFFEVVAVSWGNFPRFSSPAATQMLPAPERTTEPSLFSFLPLLNLNHYQDLLNHLHILLSVTFQQLVKSAYTALEDVRFTQLLTSLMDNTQLTWKEREVLLSKVTHLKGAPKSFDDYVTLVRDKSIVELKVLVPELMERAHQEAHPEGDLDSILSGFTHPSEAVKEILDRKSIDLLRTTYVEMLTKARGLTRLDSLCAVTQQSIENKDRTLFIACIREHYKRRCGIYPYTIQILNLLMLLSKDRCLSQIKTGEGKSTIITLLATYLALMDNKRVEIFCTSADLEERDAKKFESFYTQLGLSSGSVCHDKWRKSESFEPVILYGTAHDFEFAELVEITSGKKIHSAYGDETTRAVIVDEVDSLGLDQFFNESRIAIPRVEMLYQPSVYIAIKDYFMTHHQSPHALNPEALKVFLDYKFSFSPQQLSLEQAARWLESVRIAFLKRKKVDYVLQEGQVVIVDLDTGALKPGQQWEHGIHPLVQAKEQVQIESETMTSASFNRVIFLRTQYAKMYGVTGTFGSAMERKLLRELFGLDIYYSPRHRESHKVVLDDTIVPSSQHLDTIVSKVEEYASHRRPVLILVDTIQKSEDLQERFGRSTLKIQVYNGLQTFDEVETMLAIAGNPGMVTIATNTGGRGTDITPLPEVEDLGGVAVLITFPCSNERVQEQAEGRTNRQGRKGSSESILALEDLQRTFPKGHVEKWRECRSHQNATLMERIYKSSSNSILLYAGLSMFKKIPANQRAVYSYSFAQLYTKWDQIKYQVVCQDLAHIITKDITDWVAQLSTSAGKDLSREWVGSSGIAAYITNIYQSFMRQFQAATLHPAAAATVVYQQETANARLDLAGSQERPHVTYSSESLRP